MIISGLTGIIFSMMVPKQEGASPVSSSNENEISGAMVFPAR